VSSALDGTIVSTAVTAATQPFVAESRFPGHFRGHVPTLSCLSI